MDPATPATPETGGTTINDAARSIEGLLGAADAGNSQSEAGAQHGAEGEHDPDTQPGEGEHQAEDQTSEGEADEAEPRDASQQPAEIEVTLPGGEKTKVTLDELKRGYSREADYTRKTMAVSEKERALETRGAQQTEAFKAALGTLQVELDAIVGREDKIDWVTLQREDPAEFVRLKEYFRDIKDKRALVQQERQTVAQVEAEKAQTRLAQTLQQEAAHLAKKLPIWSDPQKGAQARTELRDYLVSFGYAPEDVNGVTDHRAVVLAYKAMQYDRMKSGAPLADKRVVGLPKVQKPGAAAEPGQASHQKRTALSEQLRKTGSVKDAAALFLASMR